MRAVLLVVMVSATATASMAQTVPPKGGAVPVQQQESRSTSKQDASGLQIPAGVALGQPESCSVETTLSTGQLRFGFLGNFPHEPEGCERRRDAFVEAVLGNPLAAKERMCDSKLVRASYERSGSPCAVRPARPWWRLW